jgi:hypothetical protein
MKTLKRILFTAVLPAVLFCFAGVRAYGQDDSMTITSTGGDPGDTITISWCIDDGVNPSDSGWEVWQLGCEGGYTEIDSDDGEYYSTEAWVYYSDEYGGYVEFYLTEDSDFVYDPNSDDGFPGNCICAGQGWSY